MSETLLLGVDFTSAPSRKKPITAQWGVLSGDTFCLTQAQTFPDFAGFEQLLTTPGPWLAALDFPFALPVDLLQALGWPSNDWPSFAGFISRFSKAEFEAALLAFQAQQPPGQKHRFRLTDRVTRSSSPMKLHYPPVGKMLFTGVPRLWRAGVSVLPNAPNPTETRRVVEGYPALIARRFTPKPYKADSGPPDPHKQEARQAIVAGVLSSVFAEEFGFQVAEEGWSGLLAPENADALDAALCCLQAAWVARAQCPFPPEATWEGWIPDPALGAFPLEAP
jgi:hypothetical protein